MLLMYTLFLKHLHLKNCSAMFALLLYQVQYHSCWNELCLEQTWYFLKYSSLEQLHIIHLHQIINL